MSKLVYKRQDINKPFIYEVACFINGCFLENVTKIEFKKDIATIYYDKTETDTNYMRRKQR